MEKTHFDNELSLLKDKVLEMSGLVEAAIGFAIEGLSTFTPSVHQETIDALENEINQHHLDIDEACLNLLACQSPHARDLRFILAVVKINTDLERMGDQAVNITHNVGFSQLTTHTEVLQELHEIGSAAKKMVAGAIHSFIQLDEGLAREILAQDDHIDALRNDIFRVCLDVIQKNPEQAPRFVEFMLIARNFERLGDHATNIAEDVIFITSGKDVRHFGHLTSHPI